MIPEQNPNDHLIDSLKQSIIEMIAQTNDTSTLARCLEQLQAAQKRKEEGDEIVTEMSIAGQLRNTSSDKQQLVSHILGSQQTENAEYSSDDPILSEEGMPQNRLRIPHISRRMLIGAATFIGIVAVIALVVKFLPFRSGNEEHQLVTVAKKYETIEVNGYRFNMVSIEGGTFNMGAEIRDGDEDSDEIPVQQVTLSAFTIGETEVTQGLWQAVMGNLPCSFDGDNHPIKDISWDDCQDFIKKLNELTKRHFRLPTEAQWEYAARGGNLSKGYKYSGSNDISEVAWYSENAWDKGKESPDFGNHPVGSLKPNELGLYDMSGNVWEWCQDNYSRYDGTPKKDPQGPQNSQKSFRVNRGGSWDYIASSARSCNRRNRTPDFRNFNLGMRLAE